ncbi:nuclear transport factor 2 family protein [Nocardia sp. NPDC019395]|uniref:nuclear transport factor 2 family protein n=1 Tax=Nocardia sp. NPDC019395 TaxID=3154686 RepID=UPI0033D90317
MPAEYPSFEKLEQRIMTAIFDRDKKTMAELMHPDGYGFDATMGLVSQRTLIDGIDALDPGARFRVEDIQVVDTGNEVRTLTYRLRQWGRFAGEPLPPEVFCSSVWRHGPAGWQTVFHHETPAAQT